MNTDRNGDESVTEAIIGSAFRVHNELGGGFLESVYVRCLSIELTKAGLSHFVEQPLHVHYKNHVVGEYRADIVVVDQVIVEVKAVATISPVHEAQLLNYLRAARMRIGLLINFGARVTVKRRVL
jgi:GxxExxY protein